MRMQKTFYIEDKVELIMSVLNDKELSSQTNEASIYDASILKIILPCRQQH
jgi:hypothetical protein